jgi:hypothetical protein
MTRDEAVQKLATAGRLSIAHAEDLYDSFFEKPVVPQCVAKWYEGNKQNLDLNLSSLVFDLTTNSTIYHQEELKAWVNSNKKTFITTLVNMHQFGYEVEEEPKYTIKIKGIDGYSKYLNRDTKTQKWLFASKTELERFRAHHTRKELEEAGFDWVFDCPGVEVKEVE